MKSKDKQSIQILAEKLWQTWSQSGAMEVKGEQSQVVNAILEVFKTYFDQEEELNKKVNLQLDELERTHPGQFERHKMFPLLKKKIAEEQGFVL